MRSERGIENTKWLYAEKPNGDMFTTADFDKYNNIL